MRVPPTESWQAAFGGYQKRLGDLIEQYSEPSIIELGGGRRPSYALKDLPANLARYTVNDISAEELALVNSDYDKACFDVTGDVSDFSNQYDVVFSRTLIEHVADGQKMHQNVLKLLKPGGVAFHMAPTLYSPPFVINKLFPEKLTRAILVRLKPDRKSEKPKFEAHYSWCYGNRDKMKDMLKNVGYDKVDITTFYGHDYFRDLPVIRNIDHAIASFAWKRDWSFYGSYAYIIASK